MPVSETKPLPALEFAEVTRENWGDFEALFEGTGGPKYCWCMASIDEVAAALRRMMGRRQRGLAHIAHERSKSRDA